MREAAEAASRVAGEGQQGTQQWAQNPPARDWLPATVVRGAAPDQSPADRRPKGYCASATHRRVGRRSHDRLRRRRRREEAACVALPELPSRQVEEILLVDAAMELPIVAALDPAHRDELVGRQIPVAADYLAHGFIWHRRAVAAAAALEACYRVMRAGIPAVRASTAGCQDRKEGDAEPSRRAPPNSLDRLAPFAMRRKEERAS